MNMKLYGIVAVFVAVMLVLIAWGTGLVGASPLWETETDFGFWGEEIIIEYEDGTTDSLKLIQPLISLTYSGSPISSMYYRINAKATGTGYDNAVIKFYDYNLHMTIFKGTTTQWMGNVYKGTSEHVIPIDNTFHAVGRSAGPQIGTRNFADIFEDNDWVAGEYKIKFMPQSTTSTIPKYWGTPGQTEDDGISIPYPSGKYATVQWQPPGLTIVFGSGELDY